MFNDFWSWSIRKQINRILHRCLLLTVSDACTGRVSCMYSDQPAVRHVFWMSKIISEEWSACSHFTHFKKMYNTHYKCIDHQRLGTPDNCQSHSNKVTISRLLIKLQWFKFSRMHINAYKYRVICLQKYSIATNYCSFWNNNSVKDEWGVCVQVQVSGYGHCPKLANGVVQQSM